MKARILVIDDEKFIVEVISQHLIQCGYEVTGFMDPTKALKAIAENDFDLVMTDLRMPEVSGMDVARAVHAKKSDTLVIILTGYATLDTAIESVHLQVYAYLNKPFDLHQLGQVVNRALSEQNLKRENIRLQARITEMLQDITTLHKITKLLYDTDDWDMTMEFVLDTLSIGLGLHHSCLLLKNDAGEFRPDAVKVPAKSPLGKKISTYRWQAKIDGISATELTTITDGSHQLLKDFGSGKEKVYAVYFTPIRYRESLLGYLVVFCVDDSIFLSDDQQTLLQVLATQIAPQVFQSEKSGSEVKQWGNHYLTEVQDLLRQEIEAQLEHGGTLAFNLLRFTYPGEFTSQADIRAFQGRCQDLIEKHDLQAKFRWLLADTACMVIPDANQVQAEISCMAIKEDYQTQESGQLPGEQAKLYTATATWPQNADQTADLIAITWARLLKVLSLETQPNRPAVSGNG